MRILITGGFGFVGGRVAQYCSQAGHQITIGSRELSDSPDWLPQAKVVKTIWDDAPALEAICNDIDIVIQAAGMNAQDCVTNEVRALEFNGLSTARLVAAATKAGVRRFIYLSTAHVYASPLVGSITEKNCPLNLHPYATSHLAGENSVLHASQAGKIEGIVIRLSNSFGAPVHKDVNCWMLLVNDLCRQAMTKNCMVLRSSGSQKRDFIALSEVCRVIEHLLSVSVGKLGDGMFNVGGMWSPSIMEMAKLIAERVYLAAGVKVDLQFSKISTNENPGMLDYKVTKLLNSGFEANNKNAVNEEIDNLLRFCSQEIV